LRRRCSNLLQKFKQFHRVPLSVLRPAHPPDCVVVLRCKTIS
jgi:hypothetical protein